MDPNFTTGPWTSLVITCSSNPSQSTTKHPVYRPGNVIPVSISVHKHRPFEALSLHCSLVGQTRVWSQPPALPDFYQTMIHTHLNQSTNPSHARGQINTTRSGDSTTVSVGFVLPSLAPSHNSNQSNLPPSCEAGSPYVDPWGRLYMQPLIQYSLQATLRYRLPGETAVQTASASRRIRVTTAPQDEPPSYAESSLERKSVTANADVRRGRFSRPFAKLRIAMEEPPPVVGRSGGGGFGTVGRLRLGWETASKAYDEFESGERRVRIEYFLESRTRWRTSVRETDLNEPRADTNERTETRQLGKFEIRASDRDDVSLDVDETDARSHSGTIPIPIDVVGGAVPTFSHQLCSRHYAVVVKAKVNGMQHTELALRVPLQICESHPTDGEGMAPAKINECEDNFAQEILPRYEDHGLSLAL